MFKAGKLKVFEFRPNEQNIKRYSWIKNSVVIVAVVGTNTKSQIPSPGPESPRKSPVKANKNTIIARLSRKSKKV